MRDIKNSLIWITELLKSLDIPFQLAGGLAARAYGATRELYDIDIDIPEAKFELLHPHVNPYITYGPEIYADKNWHVLLMTLNHHNQIIDLGGAHKTKIRQSESDEWHLLNTDFSTVIEQEIFGLNLPIISRADLLSYKKVLSRPVDREDINEIQRFKPI